MNHETRAALAAIRLSRALADGDLIGANEAWRDQADAIDAMDRDEWEHWYATHKPVVSHVD